MSIYQVSSYQTPFWAENSGFMTGRDPLGIQNSSITAYGRLLPGMTNLTLRLRYYGFYMWVLDEFFKKQGGNEAFDARVQYNFVRRAELMIAYIMNHLALEEQSVIGSNFTAKHIKEVDEKGFYDISLGADQTNTTTKGSVYWDYASGALGQYYVGSLNALGLITVHDKFVKLTSTGKELASAYRASLSEPQAALFLTQLDEGELTLNQINNLSDFRLNAIESDSLEWNFYIDFLLDADGIDFKDATKKPSSMRKGTIALLLKYLSSENLDYNDRSFILNEFLKNESELSNQASLGWYYYFINEAFHTAIETVFWAILIKLDGRPSPVNDFINKLVKAVLIEAEINSNFKVTDTVEEAILSLDPTPMHIRLSELEETVKQYSNNILAFKQAIDLMFSIYSQIEGNISKLEEFENMYSIGGQNGRISQNYQDYVQNNLELTYTKFVEFTIKKVMNDHINTAYRKMGNGESNLLKFIVEDSIISHIQTMTPKHTSPRLKTVTNFLRDLSLIDKDNLITPVGKTILTRTSA